MKQRSFFYILTLVCTLLSCSENVENKYTSHDANFVFRQTNTVPQLNAALNNMGEFSTITLDRNYFHFTNLTGTTKVNRTAVNNYSSFYMGIGGFIVGLPNIPEPGKDLPTVVCFDLACRNCYDQYIIARSLKLQENGMAHCTNCQRTYNLNNQGLVAAGTPGNALFRYHVTFGNNVLAIINR